MREGSILQVGKTDNGVQTDNTVVSSSASWSILILEHMALQTLRVVKKGNPPSRSGNLITCMQCRPSLVAGSVRAPGGGGRGEGGSLGYVGTELPTPGTSHDHGDHLGSSVINKRPSTLERYARPGQVGPRRFSCRPTEHDAYVCLAAEGGWCQKEAERVVPAPQSTRLEGCRRRQAS